MSSTESDSEDRTVSREDDDSPSNDEVSSERKMGGNGPLKKGPWTTSEDAILVEYVSRHGEGNWNAVQKHSGLSRCGKSCRLRWANHLRPDLKKGAFTPEEERRIIELHAKMGNKWARMAVELPGRTDNEIKNFWNTRTKRRQRAGLPIYPHDVCMQTLNENAQTQNMVTFGTSQAEISSDNAFQFPAVEFKKLELSQYVSKVLDLPGGSFLDPPGGSLIPDRMRSTTCNNDFQFPMPKRIKLDTYPVFDGDPNEYFPAVVDQSFEPSSYDQDLNGGDIPSSSSGLFSGSHAYFNGNTSSSEPILWAQKPELPSLQYSTQTGSCNAAPCSPLPSLESVDTLIQKSILIGRTKSNRDGGLLDAVLLQSQSLNNNNNSNASIVPRDIPTDSSSQPDDWEAYCGDPMSPLGHSAASVFSEYTPHLSGSSLDEHQSVEAISVKHETEEFGAKLSDREDEKSNNRNYSRPDSLLGSNLFGSSSHADYRNKDDCVVSEPIHALIGDDFVCDSNNDISGFSLLHGLHYESTEKWVDISEICRGSRNR